MKRILKVAMCCSIFAVLGTACYVFAWSAPGEVQRNVPSGMEERVQVESAVPAPDLSVLHAAADGPYSKLGYGGTVLPNTAQHVDEGGPWIMTRDNKTGLIWEVKTAMEGLRYKGNTYSWYDANPDTNGGYEGSHDLGDCQGSSCDTGGYIEALNAQKFGGFSDWRMPNVRELGSLVNTDTYNPAIDTEWFPHTVSNGYWSSNTYALDRMLAWLVPFYHGLVNHYGSKEGTFLVRAVRTGETPEVALLRN